MLKLHVIQGGKSSASRRTEEQENVLLDALAEGLGSAAVIMIQRLPKAERAAWADAVEGRQWDRFNVSIELEAPRDS